MKRKISIGKRVIIVATCLIMGIGTMNVPWNKEMSVAYAQGEGESAGDPNGTLGRTSDVGISLGESVIGEAGEELELNFTIKAANATSIKISKIYPVIDSDFPFETSQDAYKVESAGDDITSQEVMDVTYNLKARSDLESGYHSVRYIVEYTKDKNGTPQELYVVKTINIYFRGMEAETEETPTNEGAGVQDEVATEGAGASGSGNVATPKLIITGYDTSPKKVMAGDTFTLTIHIQNTSKRTAIKNAKFLIGNEAGSILPTSGSSSIYVESIPAGNTGDLTIEMKSSSDLQQKSYIVAVKGDFEDNQNNSYTYSENLYLPIYQEIKLKVTDTSMTPDMIGIGESGTVMFTINNQGKAGVYNVNVSTKSDAVESEETYVGNIAASGSAYASLVVNGVADNSEDGMITIVISYEDADGKVSTMEEEVFCIVGDITYEEEDIAMDMEEEEGGIAKKLILGVMAVVVILAVVAGIVVFVVVKKRKQQELWKDLEDEDLEDENI